MEPDKKPLYTIRKDGRTYTQSYLTNCGYSIQTLKSMQKAGYYLFKDGKRVKIGGKADG